MSTNGQDNSVVIATRYELDRPGVRIPVGGEIFRTHQDRTLDPPNLLYNEYRVCFPEVKRPGRAEVREGVELCLISTSGSLRLLIGLPLSLRLQYL